MPSPSAFHGIVDGTDSTTTIGTASSQDAPIMTPDVVEKLFGSSGWRVVQHLACAASSSGDAEDEVALTDDEHSWRVEQLRQVLATLHKLSDSGSAQLDIIAEKIGNGSRDGEFSEFPMPILLLN